MATQQETHGHASTATYVKVGVVLTIITLIEFGSVYLDALAGLLAPLLITLSVLKFTLVAMFFMHLKYDGKILSGLFGFGLGLALLVCLGLIGIYVFYI